MRSQTPSPARPQAWIAAEARDTAWTFWAMSGDSVVAREGAQLPKGVADPALGNIYTTLCQALGASADHPVIACGSGLAAPHEVPCRPDRLSAVALNTGSGAQSLPETARLFATPGLLQKAPPATMQGAETRIRGFLSLNPSWDGVVCLPGSTTHWVLISADEVVSFQSFLSVSMLEAVLKMLDLREGEVSQDALKDTLADTISRPELTAARLAESKAAFSVGAQSTAETMGRIWGALLGAELAAARPYWLGQNLAVIGGDRLLPPYETALSSQGLPVTVVDAERMTLAGLTQAWRQLNS